MRHNKYLQMFKACDALWWGLLLVLQITKHDIFLLNQKEIYTKTDRKIDIIFCSSKEIVN